MIDAIKPEKPDVIGLSHYVWNANLNALVFAIAKEHNPASLLSAAALTSPAPTRTRNTGVVSSRPCPTATPTDQPG